ncbi:ParA family protein [uncultured Ilyobacter sp.]|uniref:ParA family protein n=1 Tax=uncultured Ilyobacter sp. TaxID=544433 RepID=UPI0029BFEC00|nr:ParA family protein [uncultured Ilyobacter sp.]
MIVYIKNYKGGVGKSTITKNLAHGSSLVGQKTLVVTFDTQNDSYRMLTGKRWGDTKGFKEFVRTGETNVLNLKNNLWYYPLETDIFGSNLKDKLTKAFEKLKTEYDLIFIDGAPAGDNILDKIGIEEADKIIVPMLMDAYSLDGLAKFLKTKEAEKVSMIIPNMYSGTKIQKAHYEAVVDYLDNTSISVAPPIKRLSLEEELSHDGKSIFDTEAKKSLETRENYLQILGGILNG